MTVSNPWDRRLGAALVLLPLLFNLIFLFPELSISQHPLNDHVFHFSASERAAEALTSGENPLDVWMSEFSMGYPIWNTYSPLPHLLTGIAMRAFSFVATPLSVFLWINYLLLCFLPACFFLCAKSLGRSWIGAGLASALSITVSNTGAFGSYGIGYGSQLWRGSGLHSQLWGIALALLAIALFAKAMRTGKGYIGAGLLLAGACLSHIVLGYVAIATVLILACSRTGKDTPPLGVRLTRTAIALSIVVSLTAFFVIPALRNGAWVNHSRWEPAWKWDSFGASQILTSLASGDFFDHGRLPILTGLVLLGTVLALWRWRQDVTARTLLILTAFWLTMFFGRATWGYLTILAGVPSDMHMHRFQTGFEIFAVFLAAFAAERLLAWLQEKAGKAAFVGAVLLLSPLYVDRATYARVNAEWGYKNLAAFEAEQKNIGPILDQVIQLEKTNPGRVSAGRAAEWGGQFKIDTVPLHAVLGVKRLPSTSFLYHSMSAASDTMELAWEARPGDLDLYGVRYIIAPPQWTPAPGVRKLMSRGRFNLWENPTGGYFDVITVPAAIQGNPKVFFDTAATWLNSPMRAAKQYVALSQTAIPPGQFQTFLKKWQPLAPINTPLANTPGRVLSEAKHGEIFEAEVEGGNASYVLFRSSYHPGLVATIDGRSVHGIPVTPGFAAFPIPSGRHSVTVSYAPGPWKSILFFAGLAAATLIAWFDHRKGFAPLEQRMLESPTLSAIGGFCSSQRVVVFLLVAMTLVALRPLYSGRYMAGHDAVVYLPRITEFNESYRHGILLPVWAANLENGNGLPLFEFLPPFPYWLGQLFYGAGASLTNSIQFPALLLGFVAAFSLYGLGKRFGTPTSGMVCAAAYLFFPYYQVDLYVRTNYNEFAGMSILPLAVWAIWRAVENESTGRTLVAALSIAALMLCHNVMSLFGMPVIVILGWVVASRRRDRLIRLATSVIGGLALSAYFWLPALLEGKLIHLERYDNHYTDHFVYAWQLFWMPWGYGLSVPGPDDGMPLMLGPGHICIALVAAFVALRLRPVSAELRKVVFTAIAMVLVSSWITTAYSGLFWDMLPILQVAQFPWRALAIPGIGIALLAAAGVGALPPAGRTRTIGLVVAFAALIVPNLAHIKPVQDLIFDDEYYSPSGIAANGVTTLSRAEYQPATVTSGAPYSPQKLEAFRCTSGLQYSVLGPQSPEKRLYTVTLPAPCTVRINTYFYPGWQVLIDGVSARIATEQGFGRMLVDIPAGQHRLDVVFHNTPTRSAARAISALAGITLLGLAGFALFRKRSKGQ